jgi:hypothetical protein
MRNFDDNEMTTWHDVKRNLDDEQPRWSTKCNFD